MTPPSPQPPLPEKPMFDVMRLLPAMVVGMGVLLVVGVIVFAWVAYKRLVVNPDSSVVQSSADFSSINLGSSNLGSSNFGSSSTGTSSVGASRAAVSAGRAPLETVLDLPEGSRIDQLLVVGNRVVVLVRPSTGSDRLFVLDPVSGAVTGLVVTGKRQPPNPSPVAPVAGQ
ncbi:conserved hypothetical protein [uncultured Gammaproteobacteria bacterium]